MQCGARGVALRVSAFARQPRNSKLERVFQIGPDCAMPRSADLSTCFLIFVCLVIFVIFVPTPDFFVIFQQIVPNSICISNSFWANYLYLR